MNTTPHVQTLSTSPDECHHRVWDALMPLIGLMKQDWGEAPGFTVRVESRMVVTVDYDMKDLPHRGRRFFTNADNQDSLTPEAIARELAEEVYDHAATCPGCGVAGMVTIQDRPRRGILTPPTQLERLLFPKLAREMSRRIEEAGLRIEKAG